MKHSIKIYQILIYFLIVLSVGNVRPENRLPSSGFNGRPNTVSKCTLDVISSFRLRTVSLNTSYLERR